MSLSKRFAVTKSHPNVKIKLRTTALPGQLLYHMNYNHEDCRLGPNLQCEAWGEWIYNKLVPQKSVEQVQVQSMVK